MKKTLRCALVMTAIVGWMPPAAFAAFDLQITEIWMGNSENPDLTEDWFEVTNFGDMAWNIADGTLYFDDSDPSVSNADPISGIDSIAPGETVVFVDGETDFGLNIVQWHEVWDTPLTNAARSIPQVGSYEGSGLSAGGDEVNLYFDAGDDGLAESEIIATADYGDTSGFPGQSWDSYQGVFSSTSFGVETAPNSANETAVGTPGFLVPEPSTAALLLLASAAFVRRRQ